MKKVAEIALNHSLFLVEDCGQAHGAKYNEKVVGTNSRLDEIVKVNGVFRGIYLESGENEVEFVFIPIDFYIGLIITVIFYLIVFYMLITRREKKRR